MEGVPLEERERVFEVDGKGVWYGCRAAITHPTDQGEEAIVDVAS
jgi:NAD(P)-dependent dehydrogenase (short-subunit alcohol dehydrogenase family)